MSLAVPGARGVARAPSSLSSGSSPHRVGSREPVSFDVIRARSRRRGERARVSASRASPPSSSTPKRAAKNPEDWGGDYDKIREDLMRRGPRWADNLPGISNSLNWLSENTFGAAKDLRDGVDVLAGWYRAFLDKLPYRRQDGRAARALAPGRAASAFEKWEAFKSGSADDADAALDDDAAVGGVAAMLAHERLVLEFWTETSNEARRVVEEGRFRKAANRPGLTRTHEKKFVMTEGQTSALVADTMGLALALRRAAAAGGGVAFRSDADPAEVDSAADEAQDRREELLSGWGGGGNSMALTGGGYGSITPAEAAEAPEAASAAPSELARRIKDLSGLLLCTPGEAIAVAHRFPAILETPRSVLAARMASLKELLPNADAAVLLRAEPRALLAGDGAEIMRAARRSVDTIKTELPGVSADKLVEMEPRMLFEDIGEGLAALRELWPEEAFRTSERENPFFAEELALAIKALNGKGSETPRR